MVAPNTGPDSEEDTVTTSGLPIHLLELPRTTSAPWKSPAVVGSGGHSRWSAILVLALTADVPLLQAELVRHASSA